ncbi:formylglycine-generating enzyme family protein [Hymenobacter antarcticus]|uniref:Sulfatase-modifying factor enzyme-like domain-containing protein n=1 Tax=Hymenobacter antarcticus TaxID=486270 RepID=A0ABP7P9R6_9BACT
MQLRQFIGLGFTGLLGGCAAHPPTSTFNGIYSTTTALRLWPGTGAGTFKGFPDDNVLRFKADQAGCADTFRVPPVQPATGPAAALPGMPGVVAINRAGLAIDEAEIPNQEWHQYQLHQQAAGVSVLSLTPQSDSLPVSDYYTNPFYTYYPVVGISYEQATAFCRWRSAMVTEALNTALHHPDTLSTEYIRCTYRLPTEAEWELAARARMGKPYGTTCPEVPVWVNPRAAAYLKYRTGSNAEIATLEADIKAYNKRKPLRSIINYAQSEPYFLALKTPDYVYQRPANSFGLYQLLGNAAEMVQEKGLTKGGSYRAPLAACTVKSRGSYTGPAPTIGFRCVCEVALPNRR